MKLISECIYSTGVMNVLLSDFVMRAIIKVRILDSIVPWIFSVQCICIALPGLESQWVDNVHHTTVRNVL